MGQLQWTISLVMLGLFVVALISFTIGFANDNNAAINIANDPQLSGFNSKVQTNLTAFGNSGESTYSSIINSTITTADTTASGTPFAITPFNIIGVISSILHVSYQKLFGTDSGFNVFLFTLLGLLIFITAMYVWKTWGGRSPE